MKKVKVLPVDLLTVKRNACLRNRYEHLTKDKHFTTEKVLNILSYQEFFIPKEHIVDILQL